MKGKESNNENKTRDVKECIPSFEGPQHSWKNNYTSPIRDKVRWKGCGVLHAPKHSSWDVMFDISTPPSPKVGPSPKVDVMGPGTRKSCKFHKVK